MLIYMIEIEITCQKKTRLCQVILGIFFLLIDEKTWMEIQVEY